MWTGCKKSGTDEVVIVPRPPAAPANLSVTIVSPTEIDLSWTDNSTDENGFAIERKIEGGSFSQIATVLANTTTYADQSIAKSSNYIYRVTAFNSVGKSPAYSNEVAVTTSDDPPAAVTWIKVAENSYDRIRLEWNDNATNEADYLLVRNPGTSDSLSFLLSANTNTYTDTGLKENTAYAYKVYARNKYGSVPSVEVRSTTLPDIFSGLAAYYPFHGNAQDSSGNNNHGAVFGARPTTDRYGRSNEAYAFNTDSIQYIKTDPSPSLNSCRAITLSMWVKLSSYFRKDQLGYNHFVNKSNQADKHQFIMASNFQGIYFYYGDDNFYQSAVLPVLNEWHHLVITYGYDGTPNSKCRIYVDGVESASFPAAKTLNVTDFPLQFGSFGGLGNSTLDGKLDDVRIYNRALSPAAVQYLFVH
jgi:hypothetical protein